jgi:hypothetical protein
MLILGYAILIVLVNIIVTFVLSYFLYGPLYDALSSKLNLSDAAYMLIASVVIATIITFIDAFIVIIWILGSIASL